MIRQFSARFKSRELADSHRRSSPKKSGFAYCAGETDDKRVPGLACCRHLSSRRDARIRWCPVILWKTLCGPPRSAHSPINSRSHIMRAFMSGVYRREITSRTGYIRHADNSTPLKRFSLFFPYRCCRHRISSPFCCALRQSSRSMCTSKSFLCPIHTWILSLPRVCLRDF